MVVFVALDDVGTQDTLDGERRSDESRNNKTAHFCSYLESFLVWISSRIG